MSTGRTVARELGRASARLQQGDGGRGGGRFSQALLLAAVFAVAVAVAVALAGSVQAAAAVLLLGLAVVTVTSAVVIVDAYEQAALTVFGEFRGLLDPGLHVVPPFVSAVHRFEMRTQTLDVPRQEAITRDNSPVTANAVVYLRVTDAKRAFLEVEDYVDATQNLAQTTLRAVIGDMDLDDTLSERATINRRIHAQLDEPTDPWGVRVESVEVSEVLPSDDVTSAMEQQSSAERRRRAMILEAQGERQSAIETAQGDKTAAILRSQGTKDAAVLEAQGDAVATVLRARAAESMGERAVIDKGLESIAELGQSPSTTFLLPQELSSTLGRYGKHLTGSDVRATTGLDSLDLDEETQELLGMDDVDELARGVPADVDLERN